MRVIALVENTSISKDYKSKHGLCLYIETKKHKLLFDLGSNSLFLGNAVKLDVDISDIDSVIISHGHNYCGRKRHRLSGHQGDQGSDGARGDRPPSRGKDDPFCR